MTRLGFHHLIQRLGKAAGMAIAVHPHMLRHATGFKLANDGHDTRSLQHYMGHASINNTVIYTASLLIGSRTPGETDKVFCLVGNGKIDFPKSMLDASLPRRSSESKARKLRSCFYTSGGRPEKFFAKFFTYTRSHSIIE